MQKLRLILISFVLSVVSCPVSAALDIPVLPKDPSVSSGRLDNGISYIVVPDNSLKGLADVILLQRVCQSPEETSFRNVPVYKGAAVVDTLLKRTFALVRDAIEQDPEVYGTDNQSIVICGDVKADDIIAKLRKYSQNISRSRSTAVVPDYVWRGPYPLKWERKPQPDSSVVISLTKIRRRTPDELMGTVLPLVSMRMDKVMELILTKSIASSFERLGLPYARLKFVPQRSWTHYGDDVYTLSVKVRPQDAERATAIIRDLLSDVASGDIQKFVYSVARDEVMVGALFDAHRTLSNREQTARCVSSLLYGTQLHTNMAGYRFFADKDVPDSTQIRSINRLGAELFADPSCNDAPEVMGARLFTVNKADTLSLPGRTKKKAKVVKTGTDYVSGGFQWTFANGMRAIYKRMDTHGTLYYSMILNCGASDMQDAPAGESAFYSDMFACAPLSSSTGYNFYRLAEACGVTMKCDVGLYDMAISGKARTGDLPLLMSFLQEAMNSRNPDAASSEYAMECARLALSPVDKVREELYDKMHPGYNYTPYKVEAGLSETLPADAEALFEKAFSRVDDGVLVIIGDRNEADVLKVLRRYVGGFRTAGVIRKNRPVRFTTISGTTVMTNPGPRAVAVEYSADVIYTADNYFASKVLAEALSEMLSGYAAKVVVSLNPRPTEHLEMRISARGDVSAEDLTAALEKLANPATKAVYAPLGDWKTMVKNLTAYEQKSPEYWISAVRTRFTDAKDIASKSSDRISAVSEARIKELAGALLKGGRTVYYTSPEK